MELPVLRNNSGMTLIEVIVAMVIALIVFLAVMQASLIGINTNLQNEIRDEAVQVAEMHMTGLTNRPFTLAYTDSALAASAGFTNTTAVTRRIRNFSMSFTPAVQITNLDTNTKQISVRVAWTWKGVSHNHIVSTIMRMQS